MGNNLAKCESMFPANPLVDHSLSSTSGEKKSSTDTSTANTPQNPAPDVKRSGSTQSSRPMEFNPGTVDEFHRKCKGITTVCNLGHFF